ncbi:uncharacterized protein C15orf39 homolog [Synchiropus picturatus]
MPLLEGNVVPPGLKKPENMSGIDGKQKLLYGGNYLAFDSKGTDVGEFPPPWSSLKASLLEGRGPVCHFSGMDRQNALVYRQDDHSSNEGHSNSSRMCHTPVKQGFSVYTKSPRLSSPRPSTTLTVKKHKNGGENSTPGFENSVYLNIPKPVYGQNPCCHELGCGLGPRYAVEHGLQRIPSSLYEHEWMQNESRYSERAYIQRKDAVLQFEPSAEQIKKINTDTCSPSKVRKLPAVDPSYNSYPYIPPFLSPLSESSQPLHTSLRGCQSHFPAHAAYEGMTSEMYQDSSHLPKYGQLAHHPLVYYPPAHVELENRHLYKDMDARRREEVPILIKNTLLNSRDQSRAPHSLHGEIPAHRPGSEALTRHPFNQRINYPYPYYAVPRYHLPPSQVRSALTRQHLSPPSYSNFLNVSPTGSQATVTLSSTANKPSPAEYVSQSQAFPHVDQTTAPHYPSAVSPPKIVLQRFVPPFTSLRLDKPGFPAASLSSDYSSGESRIPSPKTPQGLPSSSPSWLLPSPTPSSEHSGGDTQSSNTTLLKRLLKRSVSTVSDKDADHNEGIDLSKKRIKVEIEEDPKRSGVESPPMPVIDSVFSLAPYRSLMGLPSDQSPQREEPKPKQCIKKERADSPVQNQDAPSEKPVKEVPEPVAIQVKKEPPDSESKEESVEGNLTIKNEMKESEMLRLDEDKRLSESKPAVPDGNPPPQSDKRLQQEVVVSPVTITTPKLPESKPNIGDVPPKPPCFQPYLEPSTFVGYPETTLQRIVESPGIPKPVRKNFLELHRSVCKLVSTFVSTCSARKLRDWLSDMQITESPSSLTKIKISQLSGFRARKEWLDPAIDAALDKVLERLREYSSQDRFPFPHVMRAGSVFLPMLVVKEIFFPMVQGNFIDQVLQEHKVELRPSTLSEEKFLIQCDKRASSSKLRRLMSLKHLPEVYTDIFNLVYYTQVCKHIESTSPDVEQRVQD